MCADETKFACTYEKLPTSVKPGSCILIADGSLVQQLMFSIAYTPSYLGSGIAVSRTALLPRGLHMTFHVTFHAAGAVMLRLQLCKSAHDLLSCSRNRCSR